jgi:hypothetical protein
MSVANVVTAIFTRLSSEPSGSSFRESVGDRYYHLQAPENTTLPLAIFGITQSAEPQRAFGGSDREEYVFQFDIWCLNTGTTPDVTAMDIDNKLRLRLDRAYLTATGYDRLLALCIQRGQPTIEEDAIRISSIYSVSGVRTS